MGFRKATRKQVKLKLALTGPSGAGKTYSALLMASGIGKKIAVIDTENKSASLYAGRKDIPEFDVLDISPPYTTEKYIQAFSDAQKDGYDLVIVDSITHAWAGEGGLLEQKEALDKRGGNGYTNWATVTKKHEEFKAEILNANFHMICTMRSKQDYTLEKGENGKSTPQKVGMAPIQRDGMEYEFTTVLDLAMDHNCIASKDRTTLFDRQIFKPNKATGEALLKWLDTGEVAQKIAPPPAVAPAVLPNPAPIVQAKAPIIPSTPIVEPQSVGESHKKTLLELAKSRNWLTASVMEFMEKKYGQKRLSLLSIPQFNELCEIIKTQSHTEAVETLAKFALPEIPGPNFDAEDAAL